MDTQKHVHLGRIDISDATLILHQASRKYGDLLQNTNYIIEDPTAALSLAYIRSNARYMRLAIESRIEEMDNGSRDISPLAAAEYLMSAGVEYGKAIMICRMYVWGVEEKKKEKHDSLA